MSNFFSYLIELNIAISVFFLIYIGIFKKDSNFNNRRAFLFFAMGVSFIAPLIHIDFFRSASILNTRIINLDEIILVAEKQNAELSRISILGILSVIYLLVSFFLLGRLLISIGRILYNISQSKKSTIKGVKVILNSNLHASSFFNAIFIDPGKAEEGEILFILEHESYHVRLLHSLDRILAEILLSFSWMNPVSWMLKKAIIENHEYQADNRVIEHGTDQISYQLSILNQYIGSASISNQFSNQIKNRIKMLNKNYKKGGFWKSIVLLPISILLLFFMACGNEVGQEEDLTKKSAEEAIFYVVEDMPQWPGSDDMALEIRKFIAQNLMYPKEAKEAGAEGRVIVHFLVTKTGEVVIPDPSILPPAKGESGNVEEVVVVAYRPIDSEKNQPEEKIIQLFKDESVRVIELLPDMIPGKQRGEAVNVMFTMPITFKLQ